MNVKHWHWPVFFCLRSNKSWLKARINFLILLKKWVNSRYIIIGVCNTFVFKNQKRYTMKIKLLLLVLALLFFQMSFAQQSVNASGGNVSNASGSVSYSIGQVFSKSSASATHSIIEGVHQPFEISILGVDQYPSINLEMKVYPNPTASHLFLNVGGDLSKEMSYQLFDISGRMIDQQKVLQRETKIDLTARNSGVFLLIVTSGNQKLKTFKVIKN